MIGLKEKVLIIGAGIEQVQAVVKAKELGITTIVSDINPNAPAIKYADAFFIASTTDVEENTKIASENQVQGVLTVCSETAVPTVAAVSEALQLPGFTSKTALLGTNKHLMRKAFIANDVAIANHVVTSDINTAYDFCRKIEGPWILRPVDSSGQRGTSFVEDQKDILTAFENAKSFSPTQSVLIDEYLEGPEFHVTMMVIKSQVHFLAISDRITLSHPNFGVAIQHLAPAPLDPSMEVMIKEICKKAVDSIELHEGVTTCELIIHQGIPKILEIAIRVPGGYLKDVAMLYSGIDIVECTILSSLGRLPEFKQLKNQPFYNGVSVKFLSPLNVKKGINSIFNVNGVSGVKSQPGIKSVHLHFSDVLNLSELKTSTGRFGAIIGVGDNVKMAFESTESAFKTLTINDNRELVNYTNYSPASKERLTISYDICL